MERLGDAYGSRGWQGRDPRRVATGAASIALGCVAVLVGVLVVTTPLSAVFGAEDGQAARRIAGVLAGAGVPVALAGVVGVLPTSRKERAGVLAGALVCGIAVGMFAWAYPAQWSSGTSPAAFATTLTYLAGGALALWFVFTAIADFRTRNNPHDSVRVELRRQGETKTVELSPSEYQRYRNAVASDGGETQQVIRELEDRFGD
jgi:MFS family permease